jgi:hypothetical protein
LIDQLPLLLHLDFHSPLFDDAPLRPSLYGAVRQFCRCSTT